MAYIPIATRRTFTVDQLLMLRDRTDVAMSATTNAAPVGFPVEAIKYSPYTSAVFTFADYTGYVAGTAQWSGSVEVEIDSSWVSVASSVLMPGNDGIVEIAFSGNQLMDMGEVTAIRAVFTKTGSPGDLSAGCHLGHY